MPLCDIMIINPVTDYDVHAYPNAQIAIDCALRDGKNLAFYDYTWDKPIIIKNEKYPTIKIFGQKVFSNLKYIGVGSSFEVYNGKDVVFHEIGTKGPGKDTNSTFITFISTESSSGCGVFHSNIQDYGTAIKFYSEGGSDTSVSQVEFVKVNTCGTAFKFEGFNNLDPTFINSRASSCNIGWDLSNGGSLYSLYACGGSYNKTLVRANGGFPGQINISSAELNDTVVELGGDNAGGFGQPANVDIFMMEPRDNKVLLANNKAGITYVKVLNADMRPGLIQCKNLSSKTATLYLSENMKKIPVYTNAEGKTDVKYDVK